MTIQKKLLVGVALLCAGLLGVIRVFEPPRKVAAQAPVSSRCGGIIDDNRLLVTVDNATCEWPFVPQQVVIECKTGSKRSGPVTATFPDGTLHALNGRAARGQVEIIDAAHHRSEEDANGYKAYVSLGDWIDVGLDLCPS